MSTASININLSTRNIASSPTTRPGVGVRPARTSQGDTVTLSPEATSRSTTGRLLAGEAAVGQGNPKFGTRASQPGLSTLTGSGLSTQLALSQAQPALSQAQLRARFQADHGAAFARLSPSQQAHFLRLAEETQQDGKPSENLASLLSSGRLLAADKTKLTVLDHLSRLSQQPLREGVDRQQVLVDLSAALADPRTFKQGAQGSCAVTAIGREHARTMPADFARMNVELLSRKAQTTGQNGEVIKGGSGGLGRVESRGRNQLERSYQDALMELGNGNLQYDPRKDSHEFVGSAFSKVVSSVKPFFTGRRDGFLAGGGGLSKDETVIVSEAVLGRQVEAIKFSPGAEGRESFLAALDKATKQDQTMQVGMTWGSGRHAVRVVKADKDGVLIDNPMGIFEQGSTKFDEGPSRSLVEKGGLVRMTRDEFFSHLNHYEKQR